MPSQPTTTSFALLGLLGIKSWTAYEIVAQIKRGVHFFWPRSEAHLYAELKRLVERDTPAPRSSRAAAVNALGTPSPPKAVRHSRSGSAASRPRR